MLIGHQDLIRDFKQLVKAGKLAQGYIFFGEPQVGKFYFARHLAYLLETGEFELAVRPLQGAMILKNASGIDAMREIKNFLWQKPVDSAKRTVVINDADNLTPQAQNAILKIAEEPPEHALVILIISQLENLLPAILSRFQKIYFGRLSDKEMGQVVSDKKIIAVSYGRPGKAMDLKNNPLMKEADEFAGLFLKSEGAARSRLIKELVKLQGELTEQQKKESELLDMFFEAVISELRIKPVDNFKKLKETLNRLFLIKSYNVNKRIQIEAI